MDEQKKMMDSKTLELLKSEYDLAKHECEYYTEAFNKQDNLYGVYFAVFSVVIGAIYKIAETKNQQLQLADFAVFLNQKIIIGGLILFLATVYIYVFLIIMGNSFYLIIYGEKIIVLEKLLNHYLGKEIFIWESCFMSKIQTPQYLYTKGYFNVNLIKGAVAGIIYSIVEVILGILWCFTFESSIICIAYIILLGAVSVFLFMNWIKMYQVLPEYYRNHFATLYSKKLQIELTK